MQKSMLEYFERDRSRLEQKNIQSGYHTRLDEADP